MSAFPFTLGVDGNSFPLSGNPYWSRVTYSQLQGASASNYALLGFKPGLPLQASELNEIQEIAVMENTLYATMNASWPVYSASWTNEVYGPGWNGTTPLYPRYDSVNTTQNLIGKTGGVVVIRKGWYLVTVQSSGLKHWVYLNNGYTSNVSGVTLTGNDTNQLGFIVNYETIKPSNDPSLYDNSSGSIIPNEGAPAGADRIQIKLSDPVWSINGNQDNFSAILKKIDNTGNTLFFMNNVQVPQE